MASVGYDKCPWALYSIIKKKEKKSIIGLENVVHFQTMGYYYTVNKAQCQQTYLQNPLFDKLPNLDWISTA